MSDDFKPIPTFYRGYYFRSRLEARNAVFLDVLGIKWKYESEGYSLKNGTINYLPDFNFTILSEDGSPVEFYFEVKPSIELISPKEWEKMRAFDDTVAPLVILDGMPEEDKSYRYASDENLKFYWFTNNFPRDLLRKAVYAARSARFEFGGNEGPEEILEHARIKINVEGEFYNSKTGQVFGKDVRVVSLYFKRMPDDTRVHFIVIIAPDGTLSTGYVSFSGEATRESKKLMTVLSQRKVQDRTAPTFATILHMWQERGQIRFAVDRFVDNMELYTICREGAKEIRGMDPPLADAA